MAGTKTGSKKATQTIYKKHGKDYFKNIGKLGGKKSTKGGFASSKVGADGLTGLERAKIVGAKGGRNGKRRSIKEIARAAKANAKLANVLDDYIESEI